MAMRVTGVTGFPQTTFRETCHPRCEPLSGKPVTPVTRTVRVTGCRGQTCHPEIPHKTAIG